jgi:hypothetical protein
MTERSLNGVRRHEGTKSGTDPLKVGQSGTKGDKRGQKGTKGDKRGQSGTKIICPPAKEKIVTRVQSGAFSAVSFVASSSFGEALYGQRYWINGCSNRKTARSVPLIINSHLKWWSTGKPAETERESIKAV